MGGIGGEGRAYTMKFIFIDETEWGGYFGVAVVYTDSYFYNNIALSVFNTLNKAGWDMKEEFKARGIFSSTIGDKNKSVLERMEIAKQLIRTNLSKKNSAFSAYFAYMKGNKTLQNYQKLLETIFSKINKCNIKKSGKNLISIYHDRT